MSDHRALWLAVVFQAVLDAATVVEPAADTLSSGARKALRRLRRECDEAREWLRGDSDDFKIVCAMAGVEPSYFSRKLQAAA